MLLAFGLLSTAGIAEHWHGFVLTNNSSSWMIARLSQNISLRSEEAFNGEIGSLVVTSGGRLVPGYSSRYANIKENDVVLKERTSSGQGQLRYAEIINLKASIDGEIIQNIKKENLSNVTNVEFIEEWPVLLQSRRHLYFSGTEISDRDFGGNNYDFVGTSFLYNTKLEKDRTYSMLLQRMNVSLDLSDEAFYRISYNPTKILRYSGKSRSTALAEIEYGMSSDDQRSLTKGLVKYDILGEQRYHGDITNNLSLNMDSQSLHFEPPESWLAGLCGTCEPWEKWPPDYNVSA